MSVPVLDVRMRVCLKAYVSKRGTRKLNGTLKHTHEHTCQVICVIFGCYLYCTKKTPTGGDSMASQVDNVILERRVIDPSDPGLNRCGWVELSNASRGEPKHAHTHIELRP